MELSFHKHGIQKGQASTYSIITPGCPRNGHCNANCRLPNRACAQAVKIREAQAMKKEYFI